MSRQLFKMTQIAVAMSAAAFAAPAAHAVQATTTVEVTFPQMLILYTYDRISLDVTAASLASKLGVVGGTCTADSYCIEFAATGPLNWDMNNPVDANIAGGAAALPDLSAVAVNIDNAWGVRSVSAGGGLAASILAPAALTGPGANLNVVTASTDNPTPTRGLGVLNASRTGSIDFTLNLSTLDTQGRYSGDFVVQVTSP